MAIKLSCIEVVMSWEHAHTYFPNQIQMPSCFNDGAVCNPLGCMSSADVDQIIHQCDEVGLKRYKELIRGQYDLSAKLIGDYFICSSLGWGDEEVNWSSCDWLRAAFGVAWHPDHPMGIGAPTQFPCFWGGFYYESETVWHEAEMVLLSFNDVLNVPVKQPRVCPDGKMDLLCPPTPYFSFFYNLAHKSLMKDLENAYLNK